MTTTPAGRPAWERANDHTSYGGHSEKRNYQGIPVINPRTDVGAEHLARLAADLAAVQRTAAFGVLVFTARDSTTADPLVSVADLMTGVYSGAPYDGGNPPTGYPSVTRSGDGQYQVTFAASYDDPYAVEGTLALTSCEATAAKVGSTDTFTSVALESSANVFDVYVTNVTLAANAVDPTVTAVFR
jgi:hypothetical protein